MSSRFLLCLLGAALLASIFVGRFFQTRPAEVYALKGGEVIAIRSLANGRYLELEQKSGRVIASAVSADAPATQWRVLVLDSNTVAALLRSAQKIDERSTAFNGRRMVSASGCSCSGFSNVHGLGRFCHAWEDPMQEAWCYVFDNCSSATSRGSFGRRWESCDASQAAPSADDEADAEYQRMQAMAENDEQRSPDGSTVRLMPASGCNCSGFESPLGYGSSCRGWEFAGQEPWCYVSPGCALASGGAVATRWARHDNGSYGHPYETCVWRSLDDALPAPLSSNAEPPARRQLRRLQQRQQEHPHQAHQPHQQQHMPRRRRVAEGGSSGEPMLATTPWPQMLSGQQQHSPLPRPQSVTDSPPPGRRPGRRLHAPPRITTWQLLASQPDTERYIVLISALSHTFMTVEPPPHSEALLLTARSDELSMRSIFSSFERTKLVLSLATNSLINLCDEKLGEVCTGARTQSGEVLKLLRNARRTARWQVEVVAT